MAWNPRPDNETIRKARRYAADFYRKNKGDYRWDGHPSHLASEAIKQAGEKFEIGHGCEGFVLDCGGNEGIHYLNMGDTYSYTVIFDTRTEQFRCGNWGDLVERLERQGIKIGD